MADEGTMINASSLKTIRRALDKNQTFTKELQKELHHIDAKKKNSEKAFELKRNQFMRKSLCLNSSGRPQYSSHGNGNHGNCNHGNGNHGNGNHGNGSHGNGKFCNSERYMDDFSSHPTGNLIESIKHTRNRGLPFERSEEMIHRRHKKLSLDCNFYRAENRNGLTRITSGKTMEKSFSWSDLDSSDQRVLDSKDGKTASVEENATSTASLKVPFLPHFLRTQSSEELSQEKDKHLWDSLGQHQSRRKNSSYLCAPRRQRSHSFEHLTMPRITKQPSTNGAAPKHGTPRISRQHSHCEERSVFYDEQESTTRLVLPPLTRPRSKSVDVFVNSTGQRTRARSDADKHNAGGDCKPNTSLRRTNGKNGTETNKSFDETTTASGETTNTSGKRTKKGNGKFRKCSSTPELEDLGSEVEYLLMEDVSYFRFLSGLHNLIFLLILDFILFRIKHVFSACVLLMLWVLPIISKIVDTFVVIVTSRTLIMANKMAITITVIHQKKALILKTLAKMTMLSLK